MLARSTCGGPGSAFSPSRASRAAVSASSGIPSDAAAISVWLTPPGGTSPWSVRTWRSSPEWELAISASSAGSRSNASIPPASMQRHHAERLDAAPQVRRPVRVAEDADQAPVDVDLDDVAAMDALLDAAADLADEDRGGRRALGRRAGRRWWSRWSARLRRR